MNYGFIYCLGSAALPSTYKIGMTDRAPSQRCWELSNATAAAHPFEVLFYGEVENAREVEGMIHADLSACRVNPAREFFSLALGEILDHFKQYANDVCVTSSGEEALRLDDLRVSFLCSGTDEERATRLIKWAGAQGVRMCQADGRVVMDGNVQALAFAPTYAAAFGMKSLLLQYLPHTMPETALERIMRSVAAKQEEAE